MKNEIFIKDLDELLQMIEDIPCTCDDAYKTRKLTAPDCARCNYIDDDIIKKIKDQIAKIKVSK